MEKGTHVELLKDINDCDKGNIENGKRMDVDVIDKGMFACSRTMALSGFCVCLLFIDVLLVGLVIFLSISRSTEGGLCDEPPVFCIPCQEIRLSPGEDKTNFAVFGHDRVDEGRDEDCCARNSENLKKLLELFVRRKERMERLRAIQEREKEFPMTSFGGLPRGKPAAHLIGREHSATTRTGDGILKTVLWDTESYPAFLHGNITVMDGGMITVPEAGYYYVYTQVIFEREDNSTSGVGDDRMPNKMCHFLYRSNGEENGPGLRKLLENSQSAYTSVNEKSSTYSSYIGAVFYLYEQDVLFVKVTSPNLVKPNMHGNFFGLYMV